MYGADLPDKLLHGRLKAPELARPKAHVRLPDHVPPDWVDTPLSQFLQGCRRKAHSSACQGSRYFLDQRICQQQGLGKKPDTISKTDRREVT